MREGPRPGLAAVTAREREVLQAIGERLSNAEIAERLFISVRTVESHISSLLRKLQAEGRRELIALAVERADPDGPAPAFHPLPVFVTPFIGRDVETDRLAELLAEHRLITALGPGGVGKTRLAVTVAAASGPVFSDGLCYVDLVPLSDPARLVSTVAEAFGVGENPGVPPSTVLAGFLAERRVLLVLDNCEHLLEGVGPLVEELLAASPGLTVLATSRARLLVPFERTFPVPGMTVDGDDGDAVRLFCARVAACGAALAANDPSVRARIAGICAALDGVPLAIELAAARYPSLGLDGLAEGLGHQLGLLSGGHRADDRHRSLRSTLAWSCALVDDQARAALRRVSVFATPFTVGAARQVIGWPPVAAAEVAIHLADLVDHSLMTVVPTLDGTRYRTLETVRQLGREHLDDTGETTEAVRRHLHWCAAEAEALASTAPALAGERREGWRAAFDAVAADLRTALDRALANPPPDPVAHGLGLSLAHCLFLRGLAGEAQQRYETAAALAPDDLAAADAWRRAAGVAEARHLGDSALRLREAAAGAALRGGDPAAAALDLARNAELIRRAPGLMASPPDTATVDGLLERARVLAGVHGHDAGPSSHAWRRARARFASAEAFRLPEDDPRARGLAEKAVAIAQQADDPLNKSAAADCLTSVLLAAGEVLEAAATARRRTELLEPIEVGAETAMEHADALIMATECSVAAGDLSDAKVYAERLRDLPFYGDDAHLAHGRLLLVAVLSGDWPQALRSARLFRDGWARCGRQRAANLSRGAHAAALLHGLRGEEDERKRWLSISDHLTSGARPARRSFHDDVFDAWLLLHHGRAAEAASRLSSAPETLTKWYSGLWRPWYAAAWAEAAVLARTPDAADLVVRARAETRGNPIALALVDRAAALLPPTPDLDALAAAAGALEGRCRYQWARTLVMLGGSARATGESGLAALGATPMAWPDTPWAPG